MADYAAIMTTFNAEDTVERAMKAILRQVVRPKEIIVVDDSSSDSTGEIVRRLARLEPSIQFFANKDNRGQSYSRNLAVSKSTTDYLVFFDDDDKSLPSRTREHLRHFENDASISFVSSVIKYRNNYQVDCVNSGYSGHFLPQEMAERLLLGKVGVTPSFLYVPSSTCAINSEFFALIGGFDVTLRRLEDVDLAIRATEFAARISWSDQICVERYSTSSSDKGFGIDMRYERQLITRYSEYLGPKVSKIANLHCKTRELYFARNFHGLLIHVVKHPIYFLQRVILSARPIQRIRHDFNRRAKP
jgi:glycosyltransferase involved in cell wall biosynthesis